jgi:hypothetical protein
MESLPVVQVSKLPVRAKNTAITLPGLFFASLTKSEASNIVINTNCAIPEVELQT